MAGSWPGDARSRLLDYPALTVQHRNSGVPSQGARLRTRVGELIDKYHVPGCRPSGDAAEGQVGGDARHRGGNGRGRRGRVTEGGHRRDRRLGRGCYLGAGRLRPGRTASSHHGCRDGGPEPSTEDHSPRMTSTASTGSVSSANHGREIRRLNSCAEHSIPCSCRPTAGQATGTRYSIRTGLSLTREPERPGPDAYGAIMQPGVRTVEAVPESDPDQQVAPSIRGGHWPKPDVGPAGPAGGGRRSGRTALI